jgi:ubiquinone/menaquinone biosynthesis C-methylase UbiE
MTPLERAACLAAPWRLFARRVVLPWALGGDVPLGRVLEIGGGSGAMAAELLERYPDTTMVVSDFDPAMVDNAGRRLHSYGKRVEVRQADATALPFDEASFDTVVSFIMLHHTLEWEKALAEAARVLRPGGKLIAYDLLRAAPMTRLHRDHDHGADHDRGASHRYIEVDALRRVLDDLPLTAVTVRRGLGGLVVRFRAERGRDGAGR